MQLILRTQLVSWLLLCLLCTRKPSRAAASSSSSSQVSALMLVYTHSLTHNYQRHLTMLMPLYVTLFLQCFDTVASLI